MGQKETAVTATGKNRIMISDHLLLASYPDIAIWIVEKVLRLCELGGGT
jgi:hypothetical protein